MNGERKKIPGELFIDRYMPNASDEERNAALGNLQEFVAALFRIAMRRAADAREEAIRAKGDHGVDSESGITPPP